MNKFLSRNKWVALAAVLLALAGLQAIVRNLTSDDDVSAQPQDQASDSQLASNSAVSTSEEADDSADVAADDADQSADDEDDSVDSAEGYDPSPQDDGDDASVQDGPSQSASNGPSDPPPGSIEPDDGDDGGE